MGFLSWVRESDQDPDRNTLIDLSLRPEARFQAHDRVALHFVGILGLSYSMIGEDQTALGGTIDSALGFHLGLGLGSDFAISQTAAVDVEVDVTSHRATHTIEGPFGDSDVEGKVTQVLLRLGARFGL
jgi:hypothetical protein